LRPFIKGRRTGNAYRIPSSYDKTVQNVKGKKKTKGIPVTDHEGP
jgi:hypothetical protein